MKRRLFLRKVVGLLIPVAVLLLPPFARSQVFPEASIVILAQRVSTLKEPFATARFVLSATTRSVKVRIARDALWPESSKLQVEIGVVLDGVEHKVTGGGTGGVRLVKGVEAPEYSLQFNLPQYRRDGRMKALGEMGEKLEGFVRLTPLKGDMDVHMIVEAK